MTRFTQFVILSTLAAGLCGAAVAANGGSEKIINSNLDGPLFRQLLVAELSAVDGDGGTAFTLMLDAARKAESPRLYERAVELALRARNGELALQAAQAWTSDFPKSLEAHSYLLQILVELNKFTVIPEAIKRGLAALPASERAGGIVQLPRYFLRVSEKKQAASTLEKALASDLSNKTTGPAAWMAVGSLREKAGDSAGALDAARRGAMLNAEAEEPVFLALALMDPKLPAAEALVVKHLTGKPTAQVRMTYVRNLLSAERYAEGYEQAQTLTAQHPDFSDAWLVRGSIELQNKQWDAAESSLTRYVTLNQAQEQPSQPMGRGMVQAHLLLAQIAEHREQFDAALAYLQPLDAPTDALRVETRRAKILARTGKMEQARATLRNIPELQAPDARAKLNAEVQLLRDFQQYKEAYGLLGTALQSAPTDAELLYDQAMLADKLGRLDEMEQLLKAVITNKPDSHHAYNALGYSLAERNIRLPEARQLILKALEFAPNDPFILDSLGWVEFRAGNAQEALRILRDAYKSQPDPEIAAHLGEVLWSQGMQLQANAVWAEGLSLAPDNQTLRDTLQRLRGSP